MEDIFGIIVFGAIALISAVLKSRGGKDEEPRRPKPVRQRVVQQRPPVQMSPELARAYNMVDDDVEPIVEMYEEPVVVQQQEPVQTNNYTVSASESMSSSLADMIKKDGRRAIIMSEVLGTPKGLQ